MKKTWRRYVHCTIIAEDTRTRNTWKFFPHSFGLIIICLYFKLLVIIKQQGLLIIVLMNLCGTGAPRENHGKEREGVVRKPGVTRHRDVPVSILVPLCQNLLLEVDSHVLQEAH